MIPVLLLAYHFPPIGGAAAQRAIHLVRYLPDLGYEPVVVTGPGGTDDRWAPRDVTIARDALNSVRVHRIEGPEPPRQGAWHGRLERWLGVSSMWRRWWGDGVLRVLRDVAPRPEIVHAIVAPYSTAHALRRVGRALDVPLVVDFEDPWVFDEMAVYPTALHRRIARGRMRATLRLANGVVMNTPEAASRVGSSFPELRTRPIVAVQNAFDRVDFELPPPARQGNSFRIVHTGTLHTDFALMHQNASAIRRLVGGGIAGVNFLTRSHTFLVDALASLVAARPEIAGLIELHFAGALTNADVQILQRSPVAVRIHGFLPHSETVGLIRTADLLFLPLHDVAPGSRVAIVPQKTYEYVASGRPILAAVPPGDARDLLDSTPAAHVCDPTDTDAMQRIINEAVERWLAGERPAPAPAELLSRLDARRVAAEVASLYDTLARADAHERKDRRLSASAP